MFRPREVVEARSSPLGYALKTDRKFVCAKHLVLMNEAIVEAVFGARRRLMIFTPPRHGKSTLVSRKTPGWFLGTFPQLNVGLMSYEARFARSWGLAVRKDIIANGDELFGIRVSGDNSAADDFSLAGFGGGMRTAGIDGGMTGRGFNLFIVDDPIKGAKQAHSKAFLDMSYATFQSVVESRLEPNAAIVIVMTRWNDNDLAGRLLKEQGDEWTVLRLPAIAEKDDPLGRDVGAALWPERFDVKDLEKKKKRVGSYYFAAQYQQRPAPEEGNRIHRDWFKYWDRRAVPRVQRMFTSWDMAFTDSEGSSYVVGQCWGARGADAFLLDQVRARMDFPETCAALVGFAKKWKQARPHLIENKANGPAVIAFLKKKVPGLLPREVSGKGSKIARASAVSPYIEAGNVYLPDPDIFDWVGDYVEELATFPNAANDDQVDATSQALEYLFGPSELSLSGGPEDGRKGRDEDDDDKPKSKRKRSTKDEDEDEQPFGSTSLERVNLWGP